MKKLFIVSVLFSGIFLSSIAAFSIDNQTKGFMAPSLKSPAMHDMSAARKAEMERRRAEIDRRLGVTEPQKVQLRAIHDKAKVQIEPKIIRLQDIEKEIEILEQSREINGQTASISNNYGLSGKSLEQLKSEQKTLKDEIHNIKKAQFEESQKIFTDEQKKELEKMRQEHEKKMKQDGKNAHPHMRF